MRYNGILDEKLLMSEYTFGFELEAIVSKENYDVLTDIIASYRFDVPIIKGIKLYYMITKQNNLLNGPLKFYRLLQPILKNVLIYYLH